MHCYRYIFLILIFLPLTVSCGIYSAHSETDLSVIFLDDKIIVGEKFVLSFEISSDKTGVIRLPVNRLCSLRFLALGGNSRENEKLCPDANIEEIKLSKDNSFKFQIVGQLLKKEEGCLMLKFSDDVYICFFEQLELVVLLEYEANFFDSSSSIVANKNIFIESKGSNSIIINK